MEVLELKSIVTEKKKKNTSANELERRMERIEERISKLGDRT